MRSRCSASGPGRWDPTRSEPRAATSPPEGPVGRLVRALDSLNVAYSTGGHGRWSARRRASRIDEALRELADGISARCALVALGSYGREELCPRSDIDVMVLHAERRDDAVQGAAEQLFYPFWDAGFVLGHAVRTVAQSAASARERVDVACSLLDARHVWGDASLVAELEAAVRLALGRPDRFVETLEAATSERHARHGSASELLEPDLKESAGALRDIETIAWSARVLHGERSVNGLVAHGLLRAAEVAALEDAKEFLIRLRSALHLSSRTDRLWLDEQVGLAEAFGFDPEPGLSPADAMMRSLFGHARAVEHARELFVERVRARGTATSPREIEIADPTSLEAVLRAFADAAGSGATVSPRSLDAIEPGTLRTPDAWSAELLDSLLAMLASGEGGARTLEALDRADLLPVLLPEWDAVRCRPQRDPYHRFSVDVHLMRAATRVATLLESSELDPLAARAAAAVQDADALRLAALLHDIGKTGEGGHVPRGAAIAERILDRLPLEEPRRDDVLFLVRAHLLLSDTATRRDLSDENLILDVAARVGTSARLAMLYLLTVADAESTGPHAWTPWRRALIRELVAKVERVLEREPEDHTAGLAARVDAVRGLLRTEEAGAVERYLERVPRAYLNAVTPDVAASHFNLVVPPPSAAEVRSVASIGSRHGTYDVAVAARDRPGLLSKIAGTLALSGLSILSAQAFTTEDGVAIDLFVVEPAFHGEVDEERWRRFRSDLRKAIAGRISLEYRVLEKRRHYPPPVAAVPTEVAIANDASDFYTVVEVSTADRIGLLFDLARTFHELELDVHLAKVATYGARVIDAFYVRDLFGEKIEDPEHVREIERAILARLEP